MAQINIIDTNGNKKLFKANADWNDFEELREMFKRRRMVTNSHNGDYGTNGCPIFVVKMFGKETIYIYEIQQQTIKNKEL